MYIFLFHFFLSRAVKIMNWLTMARKSDEHLRTIYRNTVFPYIVRRSSSDFLVMVIQFINWIAWHGTVFKYKNGFGIK